MKQYPNNGIIPAPHDPRDYRVSVAASVQLPKEAIRECTVPHAEQKAGKCVMCAAEPALTEYYGYPVTGNWGYGYFRESGHRGQGLLIRDAYSGIGKYGLPRAEDDIAEMEVTGVISVARHHAPRILPLAAEHAGWTYYRLDTKAEIMAAIVKSLNVRGMRVVFGSCVSATGRTGANGWLPYDENGGNHMMMILGYGEHISGASKKEGVKVRNSWGTDFGLDGDCWMGWDAVMRDKNVYLLMPPTNEPVDGNTEDQIKDEVDVATQRTLRLKDKPRMQGDDVREMQELLTAHGVPCDADGIFGPATDKAVREFQAAKGLVVDGIVGEKTWAALRAEPEDTRGDEDREDAYTPSELALGLVRHCYDHLGDIYVWGGNGQTEISEAWIRSMDTSEANAQRSIKFWNSQKAAGVTEIAAFDCSGLISRYLQELGLVAKKRNCDHLWDMSEPVARAELSPGDLLFRSRDGDAYHVGVYVGKGRAIEAKGRDDGIVIRGLNAFGIGYWTHCRRLKPLLD